MKFRTLRRWTVRSLRVAALVGVLALGAVSVRGQSAPPAAGRTFATKKTFTKNTTFNLPIQMDERTRGTLKEVHLYVKTGSADWVRQDVATPQTPHFTYRVPQDGEYWFGLVTVDKAGKQVPADINLEPPALRVVVDTRPPVLETAILTEHGETHLRVSVIDANPDLASVKATALEGGERPLAPVPGHPGTFRLAPTDLAVPIRVSAADLSGNVGSRELLARDLMPGAAPVAQVPTTLPSPALPPAVMSTLPPVVPLPTPPTQVATVPAAAPIASPPVAAAPTVVPATPPAPLVSPPAAPTVVNNVPAYVPPAAPTAPVAQPPAVASAAPAVPQPSSAVVNSAAYRQNFDNSSDKPVRKVLNTPRAQVEYRIDTVGPSGIGRVDVYITPDRGQSWTKVAEDADKRSPAEITLPGEGLFGVRLAITNGNGFGGRAPKAGDRPQQFIEVDTTPPAVQMQQYEMVPSAAAIDIHWTASDANLASEPVSIFYRTRPESSWQPVAQHIKNDGMCRWVLPRDIGGQVFLKVEVIDLAGNLTKVETPGPIMLDQTEPEATLVDVIGRPNR